MHPKSADAELMILQTRIAGNGVFGDLPKFVDLFFGKSEPLCRRRFK